MINTITKLQLQQNLAINTFNILLSNQAANPRSAKYDLFYPSTSSYANYSKYDFAGIRIDVNDLNSVPIIITNESNNYSINFGSYTINSPQAPLLCYNKSTYIKSPLNNGAVQFICSDYNISINQDSRPQLFQLDLHDDRISYSLAAEPYFKTDIRDDKLVIEFLGGENPMAELDLNKYDFISVAKNEVGNYEATYFFR
ncbi:MAG: hypothetical protein BEN18_01450 [Epulopiscium sp. Nuni2H_MBin001]|nr:MAG: hypothetical protein BEN18_01450 [Epulopiscium sp. Nuni2H_MBin001]